MSSERDNKRSSATGLTPHHTSTDLTGSVCPNHTRNIPLRLHITPQIVSVLLTKTAELKPWKTAFEKLDNAVVFFFLHCYSKYSTDFLVSNFDEIVSSIKSSSSETCFFNYYFG